MMRHMVLMRCSNNIEAILTELEIFFASFEGVVDFQMGANAAIEPAVMHGFTHGFTIDFANAKDRDRYVHDANHKAIGAKIVGACPNGLDDVLVFDLALSDKKDNW